MEILDLVAQRLDTTEITEEIQITVNRVEQFIKEYCCLAEIPTSLWPLWADMVCDILNNHGNAGNIASASLASVSMGDVSYSFDQNSDLNGTINNLMANYRHRLNKVRRGLFR